MNSYIFLPQFCKYKIKNDSTIIPLIVKDRLRWCYQFLYHFGVFLLSIMRKSPPVSQKHLQNIEPKLLTIIFKTNNGK